VANTGHRHPRVVAAIKEQADAYLHVMVYGEFVQSPQVRFAQLLAAHLPPQLNSVYFTNSGAEAVEGAMKLAKRATGRSEIAAFKNSYHGSTQGALSVIGDEYWRQAYRPLLPDVLHLEYNSPHDLQHITSTTALVIAETIQAEAGILPPTVEWLRALRNRCTETGTLLAFDEIQSGFGRTGKLWGFEHFGVVPDILLLGKALGGGLPLGAFLADRLLMTHLSQNPVLGHITTFGGHPLCCAAGMAAFEVLLEERMFEGVLAKEQLFRSLITNPNIRSIQSFGLWMALDLGSFESCKRTVDQCLEKGLVTDWFLFAPGSLRISPPLTISESQIREACAIINSCS
jgi:acetylornithine/succinyldiaminopimelate/putrescine aminotransferase